MNIEKIRIEKNDILISKPEICHFCDRGIDPIIINKFPYRFYSECNIVVTYKCPCCEQIFFAKYQINSFDSCYSTLYPFDVIGGHKTRLDFSKEIKSISEKFVETYNDAFVAEQSGCKEIVGIGYRRAFEFLVKDYAMYSSPSEEEQIITMSLSDCVKKYIKDDETKELLLRTTWIGNDFSHYEKKHSEVNIEDLKQLIDLSMREIESEIKKKNYILSISNANKPK